jgi:hypothetical protein
VTRKVEGDPHVVQWHANEPFAVDVEPFEVEVELEGDAEGGEPQSLWVTRKGDGTAPRVRFFQGGELKDLTELKDLELDLKDLEGVHVFSTPDGGAHTFQWRTDDDEDHEHEADEEHGDDDLPRIRRRVLGLPAPPAPGGPVAGELRDLRRQLDELREELRELRQALRRARADAGGGMR